MPDAGCDKTPNSAKVAKLVKPTLLLACDFSDRFKDILSENYKISSPAAVRQMEVAAIRFDGVEALVTKGGIKQNQQIIDASPDLGMVAFFGTGFEGIDLAAASARDLVVTHSPGANASSVADFAMAQILASTRQILAADRFVRDGKWVSNALVSMPAVAGVKGAKLGIFGLGAIGCKVAQRAAIFEMDIGYFSRARKKEQPYRYLPSLEQLADWADILLVAARADCNNRHIIGSDIISRLGTSGYIVNIARGSLIDSAALAKALEQEAIAGAALDVFENEPHVSERLLNAPNLILSPHIAYATVEAREAQEDMVLANLKAYFAGAAVPNPVIKV
ncbi:2-hydroxyacid dehydrogenase [Brucella sp.]|jgi:glyoxylate reductase|uniref:2-hydroxyacid dehydrogenase n=1 Tax=Brucella sp. TaxID=52132 RepID=UPI002897DDA8|nr:2-hydroxyacid dehydrogenase [Brucella sp.]